MSRRLLVSGRVPLARGSCLDRVHGADGATAPTAQQANYTIYPRRRNRVRRLLPDHEQGRPGRGEEARQRQASQFTGSPEAFSPPTQIPFLNGAIARKPDAILIAPTDKTALIAPIQRAINAGIPVATVDTFITKPIAFTNISTDNLAGGRAAADALVKAIGGSGDVAAISVNPGISTTDQRRRASSRS